jgi:hypothetical protein
MACDIFTSRILLARRVHGWSSRGYPGKLRQSLRNPLGGCLVKSDQNQVVLFNLESGTISNENLLGFDWPDKE